MKLHRPFAPSLWLALYLLTIIHLSPSPPVCLSSVNPSVRSLSISLLVCCPPVFHLSVFPTDPLPNSLSTCLSSHLLSPFSCLPVSLSTYHSVYEQDASE